MGTSNDRRPTAPRPRTQTPREPALEGDRYSLVDQGRLSAPMPVPAKGYRPMPVPVDTPLPGSAGPRSFSPAPGASDLDVKAIQRAAKRAGVGVSIPPPAHAEEPAEEYPPRNLRPLPWWGREDGVAKVLGAIGALAVTIGGVYATVRATAPKEEKAPILVACPPLPPNATDEDRNKQPDVCRMLWEHDGDINRAFRVLDSIEKRERDAQLLKEQTPPAAIITGRPPQ